MGEGKGEEDKGRVVALYSICEKGEKRGGKGKGGGHFGNCILSMIVNTRYVLNQYLHFNLLLSLICMYS